MNGQILLQAVDIVLLKNCVMFNFDKLSHTWNSVGNFKIKLHEFSEQMNIFLTLCILQARISFFIFEY